MIIQPKSSLIKQKPSREGHVIFSINHSAHDTSECGIFVSETSSDWSSPPFAFWIFMASYRDVEHPSNEIREILEESFTSLTILALYVSVEISFLSRIDRTYLTVTVPQPQPRHPIQ